MFQLRWVWTRMAGCHRRYVFALFSTAALAVLALGNSMITARIMDTVFYPLQESGMVTPEVMHQLIVLVAVLVGFVLFRTGFGYLQIMMYETCSQKLIYELRRDLYKNMQEQDQAFYGTYRTGDLMTRLTGDMDMIRHAVCWVIRQLISCTVLFFTTAITFLVTDWQFALTMLAVTPFIFFLTYMFSKRVRPLYVDVREKLSSLNTAAQENISGNRVVKAFAREDYEIARFDEKNQAYREANKTSSLLWLKFSPYIETLSQSLSIAVLLVGGIFLINGRITIGTFTMFNGLTWTLSDPMRMLGMHLNDLQRFFASSSKIIELYYSKSTIVSRPDAIKPEGRIKGEIQFKGAGLKLHGTEVLKDIDLTVDPGETVAIMGPTGAGKTSLISLIPRFTDVTKGEVDIDGIPVRRYDLKSLRSSIGIATQDVFLFSGTIRSNIVLRDEFPEEEIRKACEYVNADKFIYRLEGGLDEVVRERGNNFSAGQRQLLSFARTILHKPAVMILDEATANIDTETELLIQDSLEKMKNIGTMLIVAHRLSTIQHADNIILLSHGEILEQGTHQELLHKKGRYYNLYTLQYNKEQLQRA